MVLFGARMKWWFGKRQEAQRKAREDRKNVLDGLDSEVSKARVALDRAKDDISVRGCCLN